MTLNWKALLIATLIGTVLQVAMVLAGHANKDIAKFFAVGGMGFSFVAGVIYSQLARGATNGEVAIGGLLSGAACALIGIFVSYMQGDVPASLLALGTVSSAVTGALGGWLGRVVHPLAIAVVTSTLLLGVHPREAAAQATVVARAIVPVAPAAHVVDFSWIAGTWEGRLAGTAGVAEVTFTSPKAGIITGVMRLVQDEKILVVELITMVDAPNGVEMRFRHFSPELVAYEPQFKQTMRLESHDADKDVFENTVAYDKALMSTQPRVTVWARRGANEFVGHSDIIGEDGKPGAVEVTYKRLK